LAFTGVADGVLIVGGLVLIIGGGSLVSLTYRRRQWTMAPPNRRAIRVRANAASTRSRRGRR
jgi:hypothetical protein